MKHYKLVFYILTISLIWISCGGDDIAPEIEIHTPIENSTFFITQTLSLDASITDNEELDFAVVTLTGPNGSLMLRKVELSGDSQTIQEEFELLYPTEGTILLSINAVDKCENNTLIERSFEYKPIPTGSVELNFKLLYNGAPLVMFEPYDYPDGKNMNFTRCSFYTSETKLDGTTINDIEFHNLTNSHASLPFANNGYTWKIDHVPTGNYNNISFNIGVPEALNNQDPGDFPSGHPLAKPAENWFSWMSFIFLKVEGKIDLDNDGIAEEGIALHTGSNQALRNIALEYPIEVEKNEIARINLVFDIYKLFDGADRIYPIEETPQIHTLSQLHAVEEISNNLTNAIYKF